MADEKDTNPNQPAVNAKGTPPPLPPRRGRTVSPWLLYTWVGVTLVILVFFILTFLPSDKNKPITPSTGTVASSTTAVIPSQVVWFEDFEDTLLPDWTFYWLNLREYGENKNHVLVGYDNAPTYAKLSATPPSSTPKFFYGTHREIPLDFTKPYTVAFDFKGRGPIELIRFGHIRLRLTDQLPNLSFDPNDRKQYHSFNLPPWGADRVNKSSFHFQIQVTPATQVLEVYIDKEKIGQIQYSDTLRPSADFSFYEIPASEGNTDSAVLFDNILVHGTPSHPLEGIKVPSADANITLELSSKDLTKDPHFRESIKSAWDLYNSGEFKAALESFNAVIKEYPRSAEAYNGQGLCYKGLGDMESARQSWVHSLSEDSTYHPARQNLGL